MSADGAPTTERVDIDITEILHRIPHRYPFLLIDRAEDYRPHESIIGIKCVTVNEPFFAGHFPGNPVMPGVLLVEAMAQTGAVLMSKTLQAVDVSTKTHRVFMTVDEAQASAAPSGRATFRRMRMEVMRVRGEDLQVPRQGDGGRQGGRPMRIRRHGHFRNTAGAPAGHILESPA